uniref:caprin-2 isoform X2 n=1 Tax=Monopterus albus TaxID=43700 RepID=UPI0009B37609|nr:caprin-2 isoform X2 [Monopterus albus]
MVQLSPSPVLEVAPPPECSEGDGRQKDTMTAGSSKMGLPSGPDALQLNLEISTIYHGYETYVEDGIICLKHKVRNLEKKKLKLEEYKKRLNRGEALNKDQMAAVERYEEVLHNLDFARELHKTLDGLTQNLLTAQKKAMKKEQVEKLEQERKRLSMVLQVQHLLHSLQQEHVRSDLLAGHNQAPHVPAQQLHSLSQLATLLGVKRDNRLSLAEQMEQAAVVYLDLLEGKDKPVAGATFKLLKEELTMLLNCKYFSYLPPPKPNKTPEVFLNSNSHITTSKSNPSKVSKESWKEDFHAITEKEPPDYWDMDLAAGPTSPQTAVHKSWKGAATFIPKVPVTTKKQSDLKQRKKRKAKGEQNAKSVVHMDMPEEVFNSSSGLPKDPILRKQHLEDLMTKIHGSFSFMQDSLLDGEGSPPNGLKRRLSGSPSPLAQTDFGSPVEVLNKAMHSTPLSTSLMERKVSLTSVDQCLDDCDPELSSTDLHHEAIQLAERKAFSSPPLYCRESTISVNLEDESHPHIFKMNASLSQNGEEKFKQGSAVFPEHMYSTASTQTPPEFAPLEDESQPVYQSAYMVSNGGQIFPAPCQSGGSMGRPGQSYHTRGSVRGMARGGKGLAQTFRSSGWHRGGPYIPQAHPRDSGPLLYPARDSGYQHSYRRGGGRHNSSAWSDSSQVSSPDREGTFTVVDSGHGDSLSVSTLEVPLTPHSHPHTTLLPMQLYPLSQPLRVAFTASRTANFAPGNLDQPIVFDQLHSNLGEMYDTHIGRFTCPINGTYVFIFHILKLAINVPLYINLMRNEDVMVSAYANDGAPDHETASNHAILPLFQGDQVWLRLHRGAIYGSTWKYSTFSGFMLYQD